jgi:hypothetical protein
MTQRQMRSTAYANGVGGTYDSALLEFIDKQMQSLIPKLFPIVDWLKSEGRVRKVSPEGKYITFAVETNVGSNAGFRGEGDYLPTADTVDMAQGKLPYMKGIKGRVGLSWEALQFGKEGVGSFADLMKQEFMGVQTAMKQAASPAMWGCGDAVLARTQTVAASTTMGVDVAETYANTFPGTRWLHVGQSIIACELDDTYDADTTMTAATTIASIESDSSLTLAATRTVDDNSHIVEHQATDTADSTECTKGSVTINTAYSSRYPVGFLAMCDPGGASGYFNGNGYGYGHALKSTYYGGYCNIDESSYSSWKPNVSHNSGTARSLTLGLFYRMFNKICKKTGSFDPKVTSWMSPDMHVELVDLLEHYVEFKPRQLEPGFDKFDVMINGTKVPIRLDFYCPGHIFFLSPSDITFAESVPCQVDKTTGSLWTKVADKQNFEAVWNWMFQIYTKKRNAHGIITDLSYTVSS